MSHEFISIACSRRPNDRLRTVWSYNCLVIQNENETQFDALLSCLYAIQNYKPKSYQNLFCYSCVGELWGIQPMQYYVNDPSIHHLFKQNEQTYKKSKLIKNIQYRARCQGAPWAVRPFTRGP